jgi:G3E family GTPase
MSGTGGRIRLSVLGGFLGSGKTTWLRHQLRYGLISDDVLVIVNEAAERPVDDALLGGSVRRSALAGCCVCCDGRDRLVAHLRRICDARVGDEPSGRVDRIVLETSGLADPAPIVDAIRADPVLVHHVVVGEIVVAVDGLHGLAQMQGEPLSRRQVETADRLVVTKVDVVGEAGLVRLLATLRAINPGAEISGAVMGSAAPLPDFADAAPAALPDVADAGSPIVAARLELGETVDWTAFSLWLSALLHARGEEVMRVKGVVRTPAGRLLLQSVRKVVQQPEILPDGDAEARRDDNAIAVIGRGFKPEDLDRSLRAFAGG